MNVLFESPLGALLARPWLDAAGLFLAAEVDLVDENLNAGGILGDAADCSGHLVHLRFALV